MDYKYLMEMMLRHLDEGILVVDTEAIVTFFNEPATNISGITQNEAIGKSILDIFSGLTEETSTFYQVLRTGEPIIDHIQTYVNYQGKEVSTLTSTIPLIKEGEIIGAMEIYRDFTHLRELTEKIAALQNELYKKKHKENSFNSNGTVYTIEDIIGNSSEIELLRKKITKIADSSSPVLVYGETGTGKELLVQAIHNASIKRRNKPFIAQNCAAIPNALLESILFGTSTGSFTGAKERPGLFELADGGTLFLDEISSMDKELQGKLLRVLQDGIVRRLGSSRTTQVDVRIIAAFNEEPERILQEKILREDLYYRLNVISLGIPALRYRRSDIELLTKHFIEENNAMLQKKVSGVSHEAMEVLKSYGWPGNIRELKYTLESLMNFIEGSVIEVGDLPAKLSDGDNLENKCAGETKLNSTKRLSLNMELEAIEVKLIKEAIITANGNCSEAARLLGLPKQTLHNKIKKYGVSWSTRLDWSPNNETK